MKYLSTSAFFTRSVLIIGIICCCSLYAQSQTKEKPATEAKPAAKTTAAPASKGTAAIIDTFFKKYKDGGTSPAIDYIFATNKLFTDSVQINTLKSKLDALRQNIGKYLGRELIVQKTAAPSLVFYSYLVKHENEPIRFTFMFYKPKNEWVLYRFKFDDQVDTELEEAGRVNNKHSN